MILLAAPIANKNPWRPTLALASGNLLARYPTARPPAVGWIG